MNNVLKVYSFIPAKKVKIRNHIAHIFDTDYFLGNTNDNLKFSPSLLNTNNFLPCKFLSLIKKNTRYDKKGVKQKYSNKSYLWCIVTHTAALQGGTNRIILHTFPFSLKCCVLFFAVTLCIKNSKGVWVQI